jgi:hypothetical protein
LAAAEQFPIVMMPRQVLGALALDESHFLRNHCGDLPQCILLPRLQVKTVLIAREQARMKTGTMLRNSHRCFPTSRIDS